MGLHNGTTKCRAVIFAAISFPWRPKWPPYNRRHGARPPRIPVWLRHEQVVIYFITLCVENRRAVLNNPAVFQAIKAFCCANQYWHTAAAVAMPDHFHALISPMKDREARITQFSAGLKRFVRSQTHADLKWQDGVFDRLLRKDEFAESKWLYTREILFARDWSSGGKIGPISSITKNCRAAIFAAVFFCLAARMAALQ
jgi:REP element-mobilizing transposase RayT